MNKEPTGDWPEEIKPKKGGVPQLSIPRFGGVTRRVTAEELHRLRNDVPMKTVIAALRIECRTRGDRLAFRCAECRDFHSAIHPRTNLARCFRCARNYNTIDMVMAAQRTGFPEAVRVLREIARSMSNEEARCGSRPRKQVVKMNTIW
jgi:DNA primase